jgi:hypothetical protein
VLPQQRSILIVTRLCCRSSGAFSSTSRRTTKEGIRKALKHEVCVTRGGIQNDLFSVTHPCCRIDESNNDKKGTRMALKHEQVRRKIWFYGCDSPVLPQQRSILIDKSERGGGSGGVTVHAPQLLVCKPIPHLNERGQECVRKCERVFQCVSVCGRV